MALLLLWQGGVLLVRGRPGGLDGTSVRTARIAAIAILTIGVGVGLAALFVNAESSAVRSSDKWGGVGGIVGLIVWLVLLGVSTSIDTRRRK